jgi:2-polyprenyl-6-methoxyphenol hydroxylase-like FAD-dependent oxidoreductase
VDGRAVDALIVGAGPVGLTMAAALTYHGLNPRIIDKAPVRGQANTSTAKVWRNKSGHDRRAGAAIVHGQGGDLRRTRRRTG